MQQLVGLVARLLSLGNASWFLTLASTIGAEKGLWM